MFAELAVASAMVLLTVLMHTLGLLVLNRYVRSRLRKGRGAMFLSLRLVMLTVLGLFILHGLEIWSYAALYKALGAVTDLRNAVYFSTITYGAIGYSDIAMSSRWHLVAAIEGINGVLLIGWSTAFFVTIMTRLQRASRQPSSPAPTKVLDGRRSTSSASTYKL